ncbi:hypothetical protein [Haliangium sp.]
MQKRNDEHGTPTRKRLVLNRASIRELDYDADSIVGAMGTDQDCPPPVNKGGDRI